MTKTHEHLKKHMHEMDPRSIKACVEILERELAGKRRGLEHLKNKCCYPGVEEDIATWQKDVDELSTLGRALDHTVSLIVAPQEHQMNTNTKLSDRETVLSFKVGDQVTTEFYGPDSRVVRTITRIERGASTSSTVRVWASDGGTCECCHRPLSKSVDGVDGAWFLPYDGLSS